MRKFYTIILLLMIYRCQAQDITKDITSVEANALKISLSAQISDSVRFNRLLRLAYYQILKPGEHLKDLDSAEHYLDQALPLVSGPEKRMQMGSLFTAKSHFFREKGLRGKGRQSIEQAISLLQASGDKKKLGLAYLEKSQYFEYTRPADMPEKMRFVNMAAELFRSSREMNLMAYSLKMLADLHNVDGDGEQALDEATLALQTYEKAGERRLQGVYELIGSIYYDKGDFVKALNYQLKALKTAMAVKDTTMQFCQINNGIGITYMRLKKYPEAITYLKTALPVALKSKDRSTVITLVFNVVECYITQKKPADALMFLNSLPRQYTLIEDLSVDFPIAIIYLEVYTLMKDVSKGLPYSKQLSYLAELPQTNASAKQLIYIALIKFYTVARNFKTAHRHLLKNQVLLTRLNNAIGMVGNYQAWFKLDTLQRNYRKAVMHLLLQKSLSDSIALENQKGDLKKVTSFYETAQKENSLKLLEAKNSLQQVQIAHINYTRKWFAGLLLTLFVLLVFLIWRYLEKQKMNAVLSLKYSKTRRVNQSLTDEKSELIAEKDTLLTQKEWLLTEIHHRVRNNLHTVVSLLESQAAFLKNDALKAVEKSQHRIYAMSLIQQKIYNENHLRSVDISGFIPELSRYLTDNYGSQKQIKFQIEVTPVNVSIAQAIPLALILNELITNSLLHAFRKKNTGHIKIKIYQVGHTITLIIADDGLGIDLAISKPPDSLGLILINGLCDDINGQILFENNNGTRVSLTFPTETLLERPEELIPE